MHHRRAAVLEASLQSARGVKFTAAWKVAGTADTRPHKRVGGATGPRRCLLKPEAMTGSTPIFPTTPAVQPRKEPGGRGGPKKTARSAGQASRCAKRIRTTGHGADERSRAQSRKALTRGPGRTTQRREVKSTPGPRRCPCSCSSGAVGLNANPHAPRRGSPISLA